MDSDDRSERFMELVSEHQAALYGYIVALVRNADDADDLLQRTLLVLWRRFDDFEPGTHFARWAWRTAKFEILNFGRAQRRQRLVFSDELLASLADEAEELTDEPVDRQRRVALDACVETLNGGDQRLVHLCYERERRVKDVAALLGRTPQSVCNSMKRIRTALFNCVQQRLQAEEEGLP